MTTRPHVVRLDTQEIIPIQRKMVLGRHPACDYVVTTTNSSVGISGRHASIEVEGEYAWVEDLGSTNGTWVRGARIARRTPLLPGERFLLDSLEMEYRAAVQPGAAASAPAYEKTVMAGRRAMELPPVPASIEGSAPRLAPVTPKQAMPAASRAAADAPRRSGAAAQHVTPAAAPPDLDARKVVQPPKSAKAMLVYVALGVVLVAAAIVLVLSSS
jgi:hypothetical protein